MNEDALLDSIFPTRQIKKVLLVNPPDADDTLFRVETARLKRYSVYPPYGLAVLARRLIDEGIQVNIIDLNFSALKQCIESNEDAYDYGGVWKKKVDEAVNEFRPDLIGVTCMFSMTLKPFKRVCDYISGCGIPMATGGVYTTSDHENILNQIPSINALFLGESDETFIHFIHVVNNKLDTQYLSNVIISDGNNRLRFKGSKHPEAEKIDTIPAYDQIALSDYSQYGTIGAFYCFKAEGTKFATALSNRGCRGSCKFCSVGNFNGPGVRQRSVSSVVDELELLQNKYGIGHIVWLDDDLLFNHKRAISLFNEMVRRRLHLTWDATNGVLAASCKDEVIAAAQESGCIALNIGVESGNAAILREMRKPATVNTYFAAAEILRKYEKIHTSAFLMIGFPDETMSMISDTITLATQTDFDWYRISIVEPLPDTPLYHHMMKKGLIKKNADGSIRFMGGAYGKQAEIEQGLSDPGKNFKKAICDISMDAVPSPDQLTDIWFYMNYYLNFNRLFSESRRVKIDQQLKHLRNLSDVISTDNGFALYFQGYLQHKTVGTIERQIMDRLENRLKTSAYWRDRFQAFGLSAEDLKTHDFKNKKNHSLIQEKQIAC